MKKLFMRVVFVVLIMVAVSSDIFASSPGGRAQGPAGNSWKATVIGSLKGHPPKIKVKLKEMISSCVYESHEGNEGQIITIPLAKWSKYKIAETIEVWVYPMGKAALEHPKCQ